MARHLHFHFSMFVTSCLVKGQIIFRLAVFNQLLMGHEGSEGIVDLTLHARIDAFAAKDNAIGSQLMALKWLGNAGSHDREVGQADLLDAFEILEHALGEIVEGRSARVAALAKKLAKKHGAANG